MPAVLKKRLDKLVLNYGETEREREREREKPELIQNETLPERKTGFHKIYTVKIGRVLTLALHEISISLYQASMSRKHSSVWSSQKQIYPTEWLCPLFGRKLHESRHFKFVNWLNMQNKTCK